MEKAKVRKITKSKGKDQELFYLVYLILLLIVSATVFFNVPFYSDCTYTLNNNIITIERHTTHNIGAKIGIICIDSEGNINETNYKVFFDEEMTHTYTGEDIRCRLDTTDHVYIKPSVGTERDNLKLIVIIICVTIWILLVLYTFVQTLNFFINIRFPRT